MRERTMSYWNDIPKQKMSSDMADEFLGTVKKVERSVNKSGNPVIVIKILASTGEEIMTTFKIPKAWTGKGQADLLKEKLEALGIDNPQLMEGRTFRFKKLQLEGPMKGFDRHYPVGEVKGKINK